MLNVINVLAKKLTPLRGDGILLSLHAISGILQLSCAFLNSKKKGTTKKREQYDYAFNYINSDQIRKREAAYLISVHRHYENNSLCGRRTVSTNKF